jgi:hypothetical protein
MPEVVYLADRKPIPNKTITDRHAGQRYTCTYDPNGLPHQRWVWVVEYVCTYKFFGSSPTAEGASRAARKRIHSMIRHEQEREERE